MAQTTAPAAPTLAAPSLPSASAVAPPHSAAAAASPTAQIASALTGLHIAPGANGQVTIHLQPADLGAVQVRIERAHDGTATVTVQVEKADTLHSFQQDLPRLHQALDRAGLPTEARQVTLHLAPTSGSDTQTSLGGSSEGQRHGAAPKQNARSATQQHTEAPEDDGAPAWRAAGINITA